MSSCFARLWLRVDGLGYNGFPRPAVVIVADGGARLIQQRETVDDLLSRDAI